MANCRSCNAPITWVITSKGNSIPLDAAPVADGNILLVAGIAYVHTPAQLATKPADVERYKAHFATCPNAGAHRKGARRG